MCRPRTFVGYVNNRQWNKNANVLETTRECMAALKALLKC